MRFAIKAASVLWNGLGPRRKKKLTAQVLRAYRLWSCRFRCVSEHSETLAELDIDYRERARAKGVSSYHRVPALGVESSFIEALADLCLQAEAKPKMKPEIKAAA